MFVNHKKKFVYVGPSKTGTHAVRKVFSERYGHDMVQIGTPHAVTWDQDEFWPYLWMLSVRNPFARAVSFWRYISKTPPADKSGPRWDNYQQIKDTTFPEACRLARDHRHLRVMPFAGRFIQSQHSLHNVEFHIVRAEQMMEDLNAAFVILGEPPLQEKPPWMNCSNYDGKAWWEFYDEEAEDIIRELYAEDFEHLASYYPSSLSECLLEPAVEPDEVRHNPREPVPVVMSVGDPTDEEERPFASKHPEGVDEDYHKLTELIDRFLCGATLASCGRCGRIHWREGRTLLACGHTKGRINMLISLATPQSYEAVEAWINDVDHGLFHGLSTGFISSCLAPQNYSNDSFEELRRIRQPQKLVNALMPCLFHDMYRCIHPDRVENHDASLQTIFDRLPVVAYNHIDPPENMQANNLICADRLELRRFPDWKRWVDQAVLDAIKLPEHLTPRMLKLYYQNIRPALQAAYEHRNEPWIKHGCEGHIETYLDRNLVKPLDPDTKVWPGVKAYLNIGERAVTNRYSVEVGQGPVNECFNHHRFQFRHLSAQTPNREYRKAGGEIVPASVWACGDGYDHLGGRGCINVNAWKVFTFARHRNNPYGKIINHFINRGLPVVPDDIMQKWQHLLEVLAVKTLSLMTKDSG